MSEENLDKLMKLSSYLKEEAKVVTLLDKIKELDRRIGHSIFYSEEKALTAEKNLVIIQFSKTQDEFYKLLQEVFPDSTELEDVWAVYVSWFRPWNNRENDGELRNIIGEPWKNK